MADAPAPYRFTVDEYEYLGTIGFFSSDDRLELVDGEIMKMAPIGSRHAACVDRLTRLLARLVGDRAIVRVQGPVVLDATSEPQPDVPVLRPDAGFYAAGHPRPKDVLVAIEVADSSLTHETLPSDS